MRTRLISYSLCAALLTGGLMAATSEPQASSTSEEKKNTKIVLDWWRDVVINGHTDKAQKYMADAYVEHNPNMTGGRAEFLGYVSSAPVKARMAKYPKQPVMAFGKGDHVVLVWEIEDVDGKGKTFRYNNYDVVRLQNGKIEEHWDGEAKHD